MSAPTVAYFRERYSVMQDGELVELLESANKQPDQLMAEAHEALKQVIAERRVDVAAVLRDRANTQLADLQRERMQRAQAAYIGKRRSRTLGKVMGLLGIVTSVIVLVASVFQGHAGGLFASVATAGCSVWLLFYYKGD